MWKIFTNNDLFDKFGYVSFDDAGFAKLAKQRKNKERKIRSKEKTRIRKIIAKKNKNSQKLNRRISMNL